MLASTMGSLPLPPHAITRRKLAALLASIPILGACVTTGGGSDYYAGPVSDHFDGARFFNPGGEPPRPFTQFLRWQLTETRTAWPEAFPSPFPQDVPPDRVPGGALRISFVGHATFLIQGAGLNIITDPVLSDRASPFSFTGPKRVNAPGIDFTKLPKIDVVLLSHAHYDHMDVETLRRLWERDRPRILAPLGNDVILRGHHPGMVVETMDWHEQRDLGMGVTTTLEAVHHWSARGVFDRNHALWGGFVLKGIGDGIFFAGDTGFDQGRPFRRVAQRHPGLGMALLPIGAYEPRWFMQAQHMNPDDAVQGFELLGSRQALGYHWGTFNLTNEGVDSAPADLAQALAAKNVDPARFVAALPGLVWTNAAA